MSDKVGIIAGYSNFNFIAKCKEDISQEFLEFGLGHFKSINENQIFEIYGGVGFVSYEYGQNSDNHYFANTSRIFLESNLGFKDEHF